LKNGAAFDDTRAAKAAEVGLLLTVLATITGAVFSKMQWAGGFNSPWYAGYWQWDPKQTAIVVVIVIFMAYFGLRMSVDDERKRARLAAVYAILGFVAVPFLYWILPQLPAFGSSHPQGVIQGGMDPAYRTTFWLSTLTFFGVSLWGYQLQLRAEQALARVRLGAGTEPEARTEAVRRVDRPALGDTP
ncbi:MAG TPA: cytochrome c biogenesis protein CcsA, partial [Armatimonadota bacterium]|nr:cytochrome c biogenesis protein CcsA [Armatimonadota bacterium]